MVLFTPEQLEVFLKMNRPNFGQLVAALKTGTAKGERFQPAKPGNFDGARDRKVVDAWLAKMDDYIHAAKVGQHSAAELTQSYLKGYAATWWRTLRQEEGKNHGYTCELMLEIQHMHELDRVCQFVMGLPTRAKRKLEESWPASLFKAIMKVENFSDVGRSDKSKFKKDNKFLHKKLRHEGEWNRRQGSPTKDKPNYSQGSGFKPKGNFVISS